MKHYPEIKKVMLKHLLILTICLLPLFSNASGSYFLKNEGQLPENVLYHAKLNYGGFYVEKDGFKVLVLNPEELDEALGHDSNHKHD